MSIEEIKARLTQVPFEPFEIELCDGDAQFIDSAERVLVLKSKLLISYDNSDRFRAISIFDIANMPNRLAS
jgi:hypothetical protein